jgi:hypothetical protein
MNSDKILDTVVTFVQTADPDGQPTEEMNAYPLPSAACELFEGGLGI